jgi:hypothetical protein
MAALLIAIGPMDRQTSFLFFSLVRHSTVFVKQTPRKNLITFDWSLFLSRFAMVETIKWSIFWQSV